MRSLPAIHILVVAGILTSVPIPALAYDWKDSLQERFKSLKESHLPAKEEVAHRIMIRLESDHSIYSNVTCKRDAEVFSITKQSDSTTKIIFGNFRKNLVYPDTTDDRYLYAKPAKPATETATLIWRDASRPVPLDVGMVVNIGMDQRGDVHMFFYTPLGVEAVRQRPDGTWEELVRPKEEHDRQKRLLLVHANRTNLLAQATQIEWNDTFGLIKGTWGGCGGDEEDAEALSTRSRSGLPVANVLGLRVKPGRDGWIPAKQLPGPAEQAARKAMIPCDQFFPDDC